VQTLGLSDSAPRSDGRLKSLFWPSIQTGSDVDYLGAQGYWVCTIVAVLSGGFLILLGHWISGIAVLMFYYLGGVGVRERSRYAAAAVLVMYVAAGLTGGLGVVRVIITALLLSNLRATWIASQWKPESEEAILPPRLSETWSDNFADRFPMWLWPKARIFYYVFSASLFALIVFSVVMAALQHRG
jgi:hypothetical protein